VLRQKAHSCYPTYRITITPTSYITLFCSCTKGFTVRKVNKRHYKRCISLLFRHGRGAEYRDRPVCLCVCLRVREHISGTARRLTDLHEILCADSLWPWFSPPLAALYYVMYFRFYGRRTFGCNGRDAETWRPLRAATATSGVAILGRNLKSMNACCILILSLTCYLYNACACALTATTIVGLWLVF